MTIDDAPGAVAAPVCTAVGSTPHHTGVSSRAHDFALSPDGTTVAFVR